MDYLKALARKSSILNINEHEFHLSEMSAAQQLEWSKLADSEMNIVDQYARLIKQCCDELSQYSEEEISQLSTSAIMELGNEIIRLSSVDKKKD
jgi:hypothetical protein